MKPLVESYNPDRQPEIEPDINLQPKIDEFRQKMIDMGVYLQILFNGWMGMENRTKEAMVATLPKKMNEQVRPALISMIDIVVSDISREEKEINAGKIMDDIISLVIQNHIRSMAEQVGVPPYQSTPNALRMG